MVGFLLKELLLNSPKMGRFNDLPKDVVWLIFRINVIHSIQMHKRCEDGVSCPNPFFSATTLFNVRPANMMSVFARLNKRTLSIVRSKCFKFKGGWFFIKGAISL